MADTARGAPTPTPTSATSASAPKVSAAPIPRRGAAMRISDDYDDDDPFFPKPKPKPIAVSPMAPSTSTSASTTVATPLKVKVVVSSEAAAHASRIEASESGSDSDSVSSSASESSSSSPSSSSVPSSASSGSEYEDDHGKGRQQPQKQRGFYVYDDEAEAIATRDSEYEEDFDEVDEDEEEEYTEKPKRRAPQQQRRGRKNYAEYDSDEEEDEDGDWGGAKRKTPKRPTPQQQKKKGAAAIKKQTGKRTGRSQSQSQSQSPALGTAVSPAPAPLQRVSTKMLEKALDKRIAADGTEIELFVKWKGMSYLHCEWVRESQLPTDQVTRLKLQRFHKSYTPRPPSRMTTPTPTAAAMATPTPGTTASAAAATTPPMTSPAMEEGDEEDGLPFSADFLVADRVLAVDEETRPTTYLVKWKSQMYSEATWETREDLKDDEAIRAFEARNVAPPQSEWRRGTTPAQRPTGEWRKIEAVPQDFFRNGRELRSYQLEGLNWLVYCWRRRINSILADEMGLGKTAQTVATLEWLRRCEGVRGPFLVVAPLSTLLHWKREAEAWTSLNTVLYHGAGIDREIIRQFEWQYDSVGKAPPYKFDLVVTSFEMLRADHSVFASVPWAYLAIDEAHRLKNANSKVLADVRTLKYDHLLLLTGTPIQNNTSELWTLLNLLSPETFGSLGQFLEKYGDMKEAAQVAGLHEILRPILLRRMKEDVETSLAAKEETVVEVELTVLQKQYYRAIYEHNLGFLRKGCKGSDAPSLINVVMELRKCCNHPFLIKGVEQSATMGLTSAAEVHDLLVKASGKLVLVDKLLPKLKAGGHKVLIFSQMVRVLDILEDYLNYRGYLHERIDGRVRGNDRQACIDRFSKPDSDRFVFLLCTRAGGLGINLQVADTVIIFDSDWNPQNDLQAQARCHRIGQKKDVKVYRLITRNTYEKYMFETASRKLGLDQAVLTKIERSAPDSDDERGGSSKPQLSTKQIDSLLKYGAYGVLGEGDDAAKQFVEADIDQILERATTVVHGGASGESPQPSTFSKASFSSEQSAPEIDIDDPDFWQKLMPEVKAKDPRIMEEPRERKITQRFEPGVSDEDDEEDEPAPDDAYDEQKEQQQQAADSKAKRKYWYEAEKQRFKACITTIGWGRWDMLRDQAKLPRWSPAEIESFSKAYLCKCLALVPERDKQAGFIKAITNVDVSNKEAWRSSDTYLRSDLIDSPAVRQPPAFAAADPSAVVAPVPVAPAQVPMEQKAAAASSTGGLQEPDSIVFVRPPSEVPVPASPAAPSVAPSASSASSVKTTPTDETTVRRFDDDAEINTPAFQEYMKRNGVKILTRLSLAAGLTRIVEATPGGDFMKDIPPIPETLAPWWGAAEDRDLVLGSVKWGLGRYDLIRADPELCFLAKVGPPRAKKPQAADDADTMEVKSDDDDEGEEHSDAETEGAAEGAVSNAGANGTAAPGGAEGGSSDGGARWPGSKALTKRVKRIFRHVLNHQKLKEREQHKNEKKEKEQQEKTRKKSAHDAEWTKRERQDFCRALTLHGIPVNAAGEQQWELIRDKASLKRKTVELVAKFYEEFIDRCKAVVSATEELERKAKETGEGAGGDGQPAAAVAPETAVLINGEKFDPQEVAAQITGDLGILTCKRVMQRLQLFTGIRQGILSLPAEELKTVLSFSRRTTSLPKWWDPCVHDEGLLRGVDRHGFGKWNEVITDPELPFLKILEQYRAEESGKQQSATVPTSIVVVVRKKEKEEEGEKEEKEKEKDEKEKDEKSDGEGTEENLAKVIQFPRDFLIQRRLEYLVKLGEDSKALMEKASEKKEKVKKPRKSPAAKKRKGETDSAAISDEDAEMNVVDGGVVGMDIDDGTVSLGPAEKRKKTEEEAKVEAEEEARELEKKKQKAKRDRERRARQREEAAKAKGSGKHAPQDDAAQQTEAAPPAVAAAEEGKEKEKKKHKHRHHHHRHSADSDRDGRSGESDGERKPKKKKKKAEAGAPTSQQSSAEENERDRKKKEKKEKKHKHHHSKSSEKSAAAAATAIMDDVGGPGTITLPPPPVNLPLFLGKLTVYDLGKINPRYHGTDELWPIGYRATRFYLSHIDPQRQCLYTCCIQESHAPSGGIEFCIISTEDPQRPFMGNTPDAAVSALHLVIDAARAVQAATGETHRMPSTGTGAEFFGLSNALVASHLERLPGAEKCSRYRKRSVREAQHKHRHQQQQQAQQVQGPVQGPLSLAPTLAPAPASVFAPAHLTTTTMAPPVTIVQQQPQQQQPQQQQQAPEEPGFMLAPFRR